MKDEDYKILAETIAHEISNPISWVMQNLLLIKNEMESINKHIDMLHVIAEEKDIKYKTNLIHVLSSEIKLSKLFIEFDEILNESLTGVQRVAEIVRNLKGFTRMSDSDLSEIDVHDILHVAIDMASLEYKHRAQLITNFSENLPKVKANSSKLNQVFLNLIINAAQAIPEGGVTKNIIQISTSLKNESIKIEISDTGLGISHDDLPHIFEPFFTTKSIGIGTGLGLFISYDIISKLNGSIEVNSKINEGTTFSVYLPIFKNMNDGTHSSLIKKKLNNKKQVLIVDDEPYLLKSLSNILKDRYDIMPALGASEAIEILMQNQGNFDAIVCDLQMQDMSGADFYNYILQNYPQLVKKIIFTTGGLCSPMLENFLESIGNCLLEKPFTHDELVFSIAKYCIDVE